MAPLSFLIHSVSQNTLLRLPEFVSLELQSLKLQINTFLNCNLLHYFLVDIIWCQKWDTEQPTHSPALPWICVRYETTGASQVKNTLTNVGRCKRHRFNPWNRKMLWKMAQQHTSVSLPGEYHGQRSLVGCSL